ncbi:MAG TPA: extracellular solute-binding protein [Candidatus Elarobacter sp.]|jgi:iron(III) transport system substrate-binding protein|nr:extracellular solute-binding protein [Candidatus Elarobacter sp.]
MTTRGTFVRSAAALGAGLAGGAPVSALARRKNQVTDADVSKLYAEAKKEGKVVWWTGHYTQGAAEKIAASFKQKYPGIDVELLRQTGQVLFQRLTQDLKSNVHQVDVFASTDEAHMTILKKQNALAQFVPADIDKIPSQFQHLDPDDTYQLGDIALMLINYNPKKMPAPRTWKDLLDGRMKDQLTVGHPGFSGYVGNWVVAMTDKYGWDNYFKPFAKNNPKIGRSVFDATTDIVSGERTVGPGADSLALERKAGGNSINIAFPEDDTILVTAPVTVMKEAPHPAAARLFMNYYYSKEYSTTAASTYNLPLRLDVPPPTGVRIDRMKTYHVKIDRLLSGIPEAIAKWRETFNV